MFRKRMRVEAIPERVYAICCALIDGPIIKSEFASRLGPAGNTDMNAFVYAFTAAEELELLVEAEKRVSLLIDPVNLKSMGAFKNVVVERALKNKGSLFYKVTEHYFMLNDEILKYSKIKELENTIQKGIGKEDLLTDSDLLAWRFWAAYLGLGVLHDTILLPNMAEYLQRVIIQSQIEIGVEYKFSEFITLIENACSFALPEDSSATLCWGLSNGLRQLHDQGFLELRYMLDSIDKRKLFEMAGHDFSSIASHVVRRV